MTYVQYPYAVLAQLGQNLNSVSAHLTEKNRGAEPCQGLEGDGQQTIQGAIGNFRGTWKTSVGDLVEDVGKWGGLSKAIGDMVDQFDTQVAAAMKPSSGGGTTSP
jgi:hypothetical protein